MRAVLQGWGFREVSTSLSLLRLRQVIYILGSRMGNWLRAVSFVASNQGCAISLPDHNINHSFQRSL